MGIERWSGGVGCGDRERVTVIDTHLIDLWRRSVSVRQVCCLVIQVARHPTGSHDRRDGVSAGWFRSHDLDLFRSPEDVLRRMSIVSFLHVTGHREKSSMDGSAT